MNLPVVPRLSQCYRDQNMKDQFSFVIMYPSCSKESFSVHTVSIMLDGPDQSTLVTLWFCLLFPCLLEWKWSIDRLDHWLRAYMLLHCLLGKVGQLSFPRMGRTYCVKCCNVENASKHQWNLKLANYYSFIKSVSVIQSFLYLYRAWQAVILRCSMQNVNTIRQLRQKG